MWQTARMLKRTCIGFVFALIMSALVVIGCGGGSSANPTDPKHDAKLVATWLLKTLQTSHPDTGPTPCPTNTNLANGDKASCGPDDKVTFNADGTYTFSAAGVTKDTGTWTSGVDEGTLWIKSNSAGSDVQLISYMFDAAGTTATIIMLDKNPPGVDSLILQTMAKVKV